SIAMRGPWPFPCFVGGSGDGRLVLEIGNLVGGDDACSHQQRANSEHGSPTHVVPLSPRGKVLSPNAKLTSRPTREDTQKSAGRQSRSRSGAADGYSA